MKYNRYTDGHQEPRKYTENGFEVIAWANEQDAENDDGARAIARVAYPG